MDIKTRRDVDLPLAHQITQKATSAETAVAALMLRDAIDASLTPIFGPLGFAALCTRSLHLAAAHHPWLGTKPTDAPGATDGEFMRAAISQQDNEEAAQGAHAFFLAFHDLLVTLVGPSLTERLLHRATGAPCLDEVPRGAPPEVSCNLIAGPPALVQTMPEQASTVHSR